MDETQRRPRSGGQLSNNVGQLLFYANVGTDSDSKAKAVDELLVLYAFDPGQVGTEPALASCGISGPAVERLNVATARWKGGDPLEFDAGLEQEPGI